MSAAKAEGSEASTSSLKKIVIPESHTSADLVEELVKVRLGSDSSYSHLHSSFWRAMRGWEGRTGAARVAPRERVGTAAAGPRRPCAPGRRLQAPARAPPQTRSGRQAVPHATGEEAEEPVLFEGLDPRVALPKSPAQKRTQMNRAPTTRGTVDTRLSNFHKQALPL